MWRQTRKCSENLRNKNCGKWESFFSSQSSDFFVIFDRLPERVGGGGAKSHSAGAPWWIMKVIWKFEDKCPTFIICSGEGGGAWPELFFETPLPLPREPSKLAVFLPFQIIWSARRASKVYKDKDLGFLSLFPEFDNQERLQCCLNPEVHVKGLDLLVSLSLQYHSFLFWLFRFWGYLPPLQIQQMGGRPFVQSILNFARAVFARF